MKENALFHWRNDIEIQPNSAITFFCMSRNLELLHHHVGAKYILYSCNTIQSGAGPGFLERGFMCLKVCVGGRFAVLSHFLKYPMKMK